MSKRQGTDTGKKVGAVSRKHSSPSGRTLFSRHQEVAVDSLSRLLSEPGSSFLTWTVIGIALALPLCLMLFLANLQQLNAGLDEAGNISLFMEKGIDEDGLQRARTSILAMENVSAVSVITAEQALDEFQSTSGFGNALDGLDDNPLPAVLVVTPSVQEMDSLRLLAGELEEVNGVDAAQVDLEWIQRLYALVGLAERLTVGLALLLCISVVLVIGNTVRLAIENRRDEILVVKLVGGTDAYVARPFLYTGIWYGVGGGLIAAVVTVIAFILLGGPVGRLMSLYDSSFSLSGLDVSGLLLLLLVAGGLGLAGGWLSVIRHLRRIEPH